MGDQKFIISSSEDASEGTLSSKAPTNTKWARVAGYGPFCLCVVHKEGLSPCSGDINRLMMLMMMMTGDQSISGAVNLVIAFYDIHKRKGRALLFCFVPDTTHRVSLLNLKFAHEFQW
jgi:hypothetical protein